MFSRKVFLPILCAIFTSARVDSIDHSDCGSDYKIKEVDIEGCSKLPCILEIGSSYGINITIEPTYPSKTLSQEVFVILYDVHLKVDVTPDDPCASFTCPVQISDGTKYSGTVYIGKNLVSARAELWWKMRTESGKQSVCMKTSVQIVRPKYIYDTMKGYVPPADVLM